MRSLMIAALIATGSTAPALANEPSTGEYWSPGQSLAGAFARTSTTREERLQRAVAYIDRVCNSSRRRDQRECTRVWDLIATARAEARAAEQR